MGVRSDWITIQKTMHEPVTNIIRISPGHSDARMYRVTSGDRDWCVKFIKQKDRMTEWYHLLSSVDCEALASPVYIQACEQGEACLVAPWIQGENLERIFQSAPDCMTSFGKRSAKVIEQLHQFPVTEEMIGSTLEDIIRKKANHIRSELENLNLMHSAVRVLSKQMQLRINEGAYSGLCLVHNDFRPANIMACGNRIFLIDFENGGIGDPVQDFVPLLFVEEAARPFSAAVFGAYFYRGITRCIQKRLQLQVCLTCLQNVVMESAAGQADRMLEKCDFILEQYDGFDSSIPVWFDAFGDVASDGCFHFKV